ncbi:Hypothetical protein SSCIU_00957 [Mammaliicoccus sciuri]|nr:Hypothetical protein SSCIU_00957 [Mammaliicoccus sciuri]
MERFFEEANRRSAL